MTATNQRPVGNDKHHSQSKLVVGNIIDSEEEYNTDISDTPLIGVQFSEPQDTRGYVAISPTREHFLFRLHFRDSSDG